MYLVNKEYKGDATIVVDNNHIILHENNGSSIYVPIEATTSIMDYSKTGTRVKGKLSGKVGIVLRIFESGSVQVLEKIEPYVVCTYDSYSQLEDLD